MKLFFFVPFFKISFASDIRLFGKSNKDGCPLIDGLISHVIFFEYLLLYKALLK